MNIIKMNFTLLFFSVFVIFNAVADNSDQNFILTKGDNYSYYTSIIVDFLNSNPNKVYHYRNGSLINAEKKSDIIEATVEIDVDCVNKYPEIPCSEQPLICHAFIGCNNDDEKVKNNACQILGDVKCNLKTLSLNTVETTDYQSKPNEIIDDQINQNQENILTEQKVDLSNEAFYTSTLEQNGPDFVAIRSKSHGECLDCPLNLNLNADGINELLDSAIKHIESERSNKVVLINVKRLKQQIENVVKYNLLIDLGMTVCMQNTKNPIDCPLDISSDQFTCEIEFVQKPWISRIKEIVKNNCTTSQQFVLGTTQQDSESISSISPTADPLDAIRLSDLEDQIIVKDYENNKDVKEGTGITIDNNGKETVTKSEPSTVDKTSTSETNNFFEILPANNNTDSNRSDGDVKNQSKRSVGQMEKILPEEKVLVRDLADFATLTLDNIDDDTHKRVILQILGAKKLKLDGIYYEIILRLGVSHCFEGDPNEHCREKLFTNLTKICKVQVHVDYDYSNPKVVKSRCQNIKKDENDRNRTNYSRYKRGILGGPGSISSQDDKIKKFVNAALEHLDSKSNHENKHKAIEIISTTRQVVSGYRYEIRAKIGLSECRKSEKILTNDCDVLKNDEPTICIINVWERIWLNSREYKIKCDNHNDEFKFNTGADRKRRSLDSKLKSTDSTDFPYSTEYLMNINSTEIAFAKYIKKFNRKYSNEHEYQHRLKIFAKNLIKINNLNIMEQGTAVYGITRFSDLDEIEFSKLHGFNSNYISENELPLNNAQIPDIDLPTNFDWRDKNVVTHVKDQGQCGSCWAFSVTGNIEGQYAIKYGKLLEFSEQELVDCDKIDNGCSGGYMINAYKAIEDLGGLESESDYKYEGDDETCQFNINKIKVQLSGALNVSHNETDMAKWLVQNGPISIGINANAMQFYLGGISHPLKVLCNPNNIDHGVLIVGYGIKTYPLFKKTLPYWIVKNSWGTSWGEQGYYRVYRGDGTCGLNTMTSSAIVS